MRIVVVEDNSDLCSALMDALVLDGHDVQSFDSAEAFEASGIEPLIDAAIVDINLPGASGLALTAALRDRRPSVGIIILSARVTTEDRTLGFVSGADIYVTKPASMNELRHALQVINRRQIQKESAESTGVLVVNANDLHISTGSGQVDVTKSEVTVLLAFARAAGHTLEVWQLMEALGIDSDQVDKAAVELRVSRLRAKIKAISDVKQPIQSIRNIGYKLEIPIEIVS